MLTNTDYDYVLKNTPKSNGLAEKNPAPKSQTDCTFFFYIVNKLNSTGMRDSNTKCFDDSHSILSIFPPQLTS